jgi:hypothetical protein
MMARKDKDMPTAPSAAIVDEQTKRAAMRTSTPTRTSPASVRRFEETGQGFAKPETNTTTVSTTSPASFRKFEETGEGFIEPVVKPVVGWVKASTIQTASGPVDVDANGLAADGSRPVAVDDTDSDLPAEDSQMSDAYQKLFDEFNAIGLGALVSDARDLLMKATSISQMPEALINTKAYQERFSANANRIKGGLKALTPAAYLAMEDKYQEVMRQYGLPESYYTPGLYGKQEGFDKLISSDISNTELEDRLMVAQDRVLKSNPEVLKALKDFYPDIKNGDILAYTLDPKNAIKNIQSKVTAAEIGGAALQQKGLTTSLARAEELQRYGVDKAEATAGYSTIGGGLQRGSELASIYQQDPYTQTTAESEIFNVPGAQEARKQRQKITGLEKATFGGQSGITQGALARDRAGGY